MYVAQPGHLKAERLVRRYGQCRRVHLLLLRAAAGCAGLATLCGGAYWLTEADPYRMAAGNLLIATLSIIGPAGIFEKVTSHFWWQLAPYVRISTVLKVDDFVRRRWRAQYPKDNKAALYSLQQQANEANT